MWTQILIYVLLTLFVLFYAAMGSYVADILGDDKSRFKKYLTGLFWPVVVFVLIIAMGVLFIIAFIGIIIFVFVVIFTIIKSVVKGEKINWDEPIF